MKKKENTAPSMGQMLARMMEQEGGQDLHSVALQVIRGDWGNGATRRKKLTAAGYDYAAVQRLVDGILAGR